MGVGGIAATNDHMMLMMQILMQGMREQADMSKKMIALGVENSLIADKMATAQQIIDVYA